MMITAAGLHAQFKALDEAAPGPVYPCDRRGCFAGGAGILFGHVPMKLPDVYGDWRVVGGLALIMLGAVNWEIGRARTQEFSRIVAGHAEVAADEAYRSFDELDPRTDSAVLAPFSDAQRRVSYATARMDFYHATFLTGQALVLAGVVLTLVGFITIIQRDNRHVHRRIRTALGANAPPHTN